MKRMVWMNKSNGQLCVTIPKNLGIKEGEIVNVEKEKINKIVYSVVTGDLFHYGHLMLLQNANNLGNFHICGVLTNDAIKRYKEGPRKYENYLNYSHFAITSNARNEINLLL